VSDLKERYNGLGVPVNVPDYFHLVGELDHTWRILTATSETWRKGTYRMMVTEATGR
jgi:hypothetical protein